MKTRTLIMTLSMALVSLAAHAQESNTRVTSNPLEANRCSVENMMQQRNGDIITHVFMANRDNQNNTQVLGVYVLKMSPTTLQVTDSLFLADTVPPFYLYARDPRGEGNIRANIEPDGEGNSQLRIAHFTDDNLHIDHDSDVVVPLCEGTALDDAFSYMLDCQGNLIMKYYKENDGVTEGHIVRYDAEGNLLHDAIIPTSQNYIRSMEVFKESPLEYCQWRRAGEGNLNFYVVDSTFQLKNTYLINKVIYESQDPYIHENFDFYSSNSNSTFVIPDGDDVLVAAYYERYETDTTYTNLEFGVAAARYNLRTMQRKALVKFNDYSGLEASAKCYGFQKMPDGTVYLLYREEGMPIKYWMTVVKMDSDLNVDWKRYCETPEELMYVDPFGTQLSITVRDGEGNVNGFVCSETYPEGVIHLILTHDGIPATVVGGIEVRPYCFYPNPAHDQIRLQYSPDVQPKLVELYDLQGRLVRTQSKALESIDLSQLPTGTYMMRVSLEDGESYADKVVKE
ncbi:MAG: T9SS type A sorting domain-containing protein [Bacteroidales bacterium]|nr:T9SS type A sorting domain-containing protein [Bacteroidales bacterium]